jgi:hypothetical protein
VLFFSVFKRFGINEYIGDAILIVPMGLFGYFLFHYFVFNKTITSKMQRQIKNKLGSYSDLTIK